MEREAAAEAVNRLAEAVLEESASYDLASIDITPAIRDIFYDSIFEELAMPLMGASLLSFDDISRKGDGSAVAGFSCSFSSKQSFAMSSPVASDAVSNTSLQTGNAS